MHCMALYIITLHSLGELQRYSTASPHRAASHQLAGLGLDLSPSFFDRHLILGYWPVIGGNWRKTTVTRSGLTD